MAPKGKAAEKSGGKGDASKGKAAAASNKSKAKADGSGAGDEKGGKVKGAQQVNVRHILCEKHARKEEALEKLRGGAKFDEVAREFSEDKARAGGALGWKRRGDLELPFETVAFELEASSTASPKFGEAKTEHGDRNRLLGGCTFALKQRGSPGRQLIAEVFPREFNSPGITYDSCAPPRKFEEESSARKYTAESRNRWCTSTAEMANPGKFDQGISSQQAEFASGRR